LLLRSDRFDHALVIGERHERYHHNDNPSVEYGLLPHREREQDLSLLRLSGLVNQRLWTHGSGGFYFDKFFGRIRSDCWTDADIHGGEEIGRGGWPQEKLLSEEGLTAAVDVFRRLEGAFI